MSRCQKTASKGLKKTDCLLYSAAVVLGVGIVLGNYHQASPVEHVDSKKQLGSYLERIITRMDAVNGQLNSWGAIDVRHESSRGY